MSADVPRRAPAPRAALHAPPRAPATSAAARADGGGADRPARAAVTLVATWLALSTLPLTRGVLAGAGGAGALVGHLALLAAAVAARRALSSRAATPRAAARPVALALLVALAAVPVCYAEMPRVAAGLAADPLAGAPLHDATVVAWERAAFAAWPGGSPVHALARWWPHRWLSELLHAGYLGYYLLIAGPPAALWWRGARTAAAVSVLAVTAAFLPCWATFAHWPVAGPWYAWAPPPAPDGPIRAAVLALLGAGSSRGTAFPSSHVAVSVAQTVALALAARRALPALAPLAAALTVLLALGAMYGGFHWGVDVGAGAVVGLAAAGAAVAWTARATRHR